MDLVIAMRVAPTAFPIGMLADVLIGALRPRHAGGKGPVSRAIGCAFVPLAAVVAHGRAITRCPRRPAGRKPTGALRPQWEIRGPT